MSRIQFILILFVLIPVNVFSGDGLEQKYSIREEVFGGVGHETVETYKERVGKDPRIDEVMTYVVFEDPVIPCGLAICACSQNPKWGHGHHICVDGGYGQMGAVRFTKDDWIKAKKTVYQDPDIVKLVAQIGNIALDVLIEDLPRSSIEPKQRIVTDADLASGDSLFKELAAKVDKTWSDRIKKVFFADTGEELENLLRHAKEKRGIAD